MHIEVYKNDDNLGLVELNNDQYEDGRISLTPREFWQVCLAGLYLSEQGDSKNVVKLDFGSFKSRPTVLDELAEKMNEQGSWEGCVAVFKEALEALQPPVAKSMTLDERLGKAVVQSEEADVWQMRDFLKKHDPNFATDEYLNVLSLPQLRDYYRECREAVREAQRDVGDDWGQRRESLTAKNLDFHG